jgi:heptosyltransferase II
VEATVPKMKILIVAPSWVGDMVIAHSLIRELWSDFTEPVVDVLASAWSLPLVARMPEIRKGVSMPIGHGSFQFFVRRNIGRSLIQESYDWAIVLPTTWKSALVPFFAKISRRTGFVGEARYGLINDARRLDKNILNMTVLRYLALGQERAEPLPPKIRFRPKLAVDPENRERLILSLKLSMNKPVICFCPGAEYGSAKQWPIEHFQKLAGMLLKDGFQVWTLGSVKEADLGERIKPKESLWFRNLCGQTRLEDTIDLMSLSKCVVTNDSGLMHVAAASGTIVQAIFGSSSPSYTPPMTEKADIHYLGLDCSPCFKRQCPQWHLNCLTRISPGAVYRSVHSSTQGSLNSKPFEGIKCQK